MKRNYRKAALLLAGFTFAFTTWAQEISLKTKDTQIKVDEQGNYSSIQVCGKEILQEKDYPVITAGTGGKTSRQ